LQTTPSNGEGGEGDIRDEAGISMTRLWKAGKADCFIGSFTPHSSCVVVAPWQRRTRPQRVAVSQFRLRTFLPTSHQITRSLTSTLRSPLRLQPVTMASSKRRMSQAPSSHVNLHCSQCDSQIGIFDNEWTRFTTSYVRAVHPGAHFGTEVALNKTQVVPEGTTQRSLEGCTLAEVFCTKCSAVVGQYCKAIPGPERRHML
jgi:hypothetical protein